MTRHKEIVSSNVFFRTAVDQTRCLSRPPDRRLSRDLQVHMQPRCKQIPMHRSHPQITVSRPEDRSLQVQVENVFLLTAQI
ncbi:hypothetical protein Bpfe_001726 [Biomphalaria pfeifferi]|uniref:Uncharacterized protein n=1 Tax=Biomphalaria pfeifferi TaxID=112525 RepID=A0AAD8FLX0_BIOPF|nr:hypothetical protein Bpfe_001726 [Biomphalaria pfeifferi]